MVHRRPHRIQFAAPVVFRKRLGHELLRIPSKSVHGPVAIRRFLVTGSQPWNARTRYLRSPRAMIRPILRILRTIVHVLSEGLTGNRVR